MTNSGAASQIATELAADVHNGVLLQGAMFPSERDLTERFGVGRSIVRDAMTKLQAMGLVDQPKGKRPRVTKPTLSSLMANTGRAAQMFFQDNEGRAHLEQARLFLETSMIRYAVDHATNAQIAKMVSAVEECDANLNDIVGFRQADVKFHRALAEVPGNPIFLALHETFVERLMTSQSIQADFSDNSEASNAGHKATVKALLAKDSEAAVQALTLHLTRNYGSKFQPALAGGQTRIS